MSLTMVGGGVRGASTSRTADLPRPSMSKLEARCGRPHAAMARCSPRDTIGLALLCAYVNKCAEAVDFLLEKDGNWNTTAVTTAPHPIAHPLGSYHDHASP